MARTKSSSRKTPEPPPPTWDERLINSLMPWRIEIAGIILFTVSFLIFLALLSLPNNACPGVWLCLFREGFGWGAYPLLLSLSAGGLHMTLRQVERPYEIHVAQVIGFELVLLTLLPLTYQLSGTTLPEAHVGKGGGLVGWALSEPLLDFFGAFLTNGFYLLLLAYGVMWPENRIFLIFLPVPIKAKWFVLIYGAAELVFGVTGSMPGIAHFAHLGGMFFGAGLLYKWGWRPGMTWKR